MIEGKLYKCSNYYLLVYPTEEKVRAADRAQSTTPTGQAAPAGTSMSLSLGATGAWWSWAKAALAPRANYWSKELNCTVRFAEPNEMFMCLNEPKDEFVHVLFEEKQGWIINRGWLEIEEIKQ